MKKTVLVTGINSLVGWTLFSYFKTIPTLFTIGTYRKSSKKFSSQCYRVDLDDPNELKVFLDKVQPNYFIHTRGICDLDVCELHPDLAMNINFSSVKLLWEILSNMNCLEKFIFFSTDHVFSGLKSSGYSEEDIPDPRNQFGKTKALAEKYVLESIPRSLVVRPGLLVASSAQGNKGARDFLLYRASLGKPTSYFTDEFRGLVAGEFLSHHTHELIKKEQEGVFHISSPTIMSRYNLSKKFLQNAGLDLKFLKPKLRCEDSLYSIRPKHLILKSNKLDIEPIKDLSQ